jgi:hypothetical protein
VKVATSTREPGRATPRRARVALVDTWRAVSRDPILADVYLRGFLASLEPGRPLTAEQRELAREISKRRKA